MSTQQLAALRKSNTFDDIIEWVEKNNNIIFDRVYRLGNFHRAKDVSLARQDFFVQISYLAVTHSESVRNTHCAPKGKRTNWFGNSDLPVGYPGWHGRIEFTVYDIGVSGSDIGRSLLLHTGTGGGVAAKFRPNVLYYGYDVKLFEDDWPGLKELVVLNKLKDNPNPSFKYGKTNYFSI